MGHLIEVTGTEEIAPEYQDGPIGRLLEYHNLDRPFDAYDRASLLVGMCMDNRKHLRVPENFAYIIRTAGANLRCCEFNVSYAIAVGGVRAIALIGHSQCGMVALDSRREQFIQGLVDNAGWTRELSEAHFEHFEPLFGLGDEIKTVVSETMRLRTRYPGIQIAPLFYRIEDKRLYLIDET